MPKKSPSIKTVLTPEILYARLIEIRDEVLEQGAALYLNWKPAIHRSEFKPSGLNLAHYIALRRMDLRLVQEHLMLYGLSSLGRCESRVIPNLDAIIATLAAIIGSEEKGIHPTPQMHLRGKHRLHAEANKVLGSSPSSRRVRIMTTLPTEAATEYSLVKDLLQKGSNLLRINCAHDGGKIWGKMVRHAKRATKETGIPCKLFFDLGGPKIRTEVVQAKDSIKVKTGDLLFLAKEPLEEHPLSEVSFTCSLKNIFSFLKVGCEVWIDDGNLGCVLEKILPNGAQLKVIHAPPEGKKIKPGKGLNFPGLHLTTKALTEKDKLDLNFILKHADIIGYSFVQSGEDILELQMEMKSRAQNKKPLPPIVAKIETQRALEKLPEIMIQAAGKDPFGVMIARGDLAVEIGYLRLAEIQEEILWLCEAADVPVIWATQVLEKLTKEGRHSRAEITDAVMGERAECVMLNKGKFLGLATTTLSDILVQMEKHQNKKTPQLRALRTW